MSKDNEKWTDFILRSNSYRVFSENNSLLPKMLFSLPSMWKDFNCVFYGLFLYVEAFRSFRIFSKSNESKQGNRPLISIGFDVWKQGTFFDFNGTKKLLLKDVYTVSMIFYLYNPGNIGNIP